VSGDLRVAAAQSGVEVADGVETSVLATHGLIAWSTATAVEAVQDARRAAGSGMKGVVEEMADMLDASSGTYDWIDRMQTR
jgi:hypothetical protein